MRSLITGASGFAGGWLCRECVADGDEVIGVSRRGTIVDGAGRGLVVDLTDGGSVRSLLRSVAPDVIYHLAALSSVGRSWEAPADTLAENVASSVNLLEAVRVEAPDARVVWVSTCEVYGEPATLPITEDAPVAPANPYAVSKTAGDLLCDVYVSSYGLDVVRARPFSHSGPGQLPIFLLSSLARQVALGRRSGDGAVRIVTGNPDTRRDFTDVRDVVRAYRLLGLADRSALGGRVFNVSSGRSVSAGEQVALLDEVVAPLPVEHVVDPGLVRASEVMDLRGDHSRLTAATGWEPRIPLRQTMADTVAWWDAELARSG